MSKHRVDLGAGAVPKRYKLDLRGAYSATSEYIEEGGAGLSADDPKRALERLLKEKATKRMRGGGMVKKRKR